MDLGIAQHSMNSIPGAALRRRWIEPEAVPSYVVMAMAMALVAIVVATSSFSFDGRALGAPLVALLVLAACGIHLRRNTAAHKLGSAIQAYALFVGVSVAAPFCAVIAASTNLPLVDGMLAKLDRTLFFGFEREIAVAAVVQRPILFACTKLVYHSLIWQPSLLIALLFASAPRRGWALLLAWAMALAVIVAISPFFAATGAPPYFLDFMGTFEGARNGSLRVLGRDALTGIITFPSFHAAAACLLAWGFSSLRRVGPPFVVLNVLMLMSALIAGHYLIDLVAGSAIAGLCIALSTAIQRRCAAGSI